MEKIIFEKYDEDYLELSWQWLNDPEIKELTQTPDFTREQQRAWFDSLAERKDYMVWGINVNNTKIGVAGLKNINDKEAEYFGYIGAKEYWSKGLSRPILDFIKLEASRLGLNRIYLKVSARNPRAVKAYQNNGFTVEHTQYDLVFMQYFL